MAHYAFINENNKVTEVITGINENDTSDLPSDFSSWEEWYLTQRPSMTACKRTSYNTINNAHINGGVAYRGNYAGIGFTWDQDNEVFIPPKPFASWTLNENIWNWEAPLEKPSDSNSVLYYWDENAYQNDNTTGWIEIA